MTTNPADLVAVRSYLAQQTGQSFAALGIAGDAAHGTAGYHIGGSIVGAWDYSRAESSRDRAVTTTDASALDLGGQFARFREISLGIVAACKRGDPRTWDIREVIYTPDGSVVHRWDRLGRRSGGDSSHLWHTHISFFRDSAGRRHRDDNFLGLLQQLFTGTAGGTSMDPLLEQQQFARVEASLKGRDALVPTGGAGGAKATETNGTRVALEGLHRKVDAVAEGVGKLIEQSGPAGVDPVALATALAGNEAFVANLAAAVAEALPAQLGRRLVNG